MTEKGSSGSIQFQIDNFADLSLAQEQEPVEIGNAEWILGAFSSTSDLTSNVKHLGVYLKCNNSIQGNLWSANASFEFSLLKLNSNDPNDAFSMKFQQKFDRLNRKFEVPNFKNFEEANCYDNRFIVDKHAVVKVQITVNSVSGIHEKILETFEEPKMSISDVVLLVEGKKVHVSKPILAHHSKYFFALFYSNFTENSKTEIPLEDIVHSEFVDLLNLIYPTHQVITTENVAHILKLADRFQVSFVLEKCEKFLVSDTKTHIVDKLKFSEMYNLSGLQNHCLSSIKSSSEIVALEKHVNYKSLGDVSYAVLLQKFMDISNNR